MDPKVIELSDGSIKISFPGRFSSTKNEAFTLSRVEVKGYSRASLRFCSSSPVISEPALVELERKDLMKLRDAITEVLERDEDLT